MVDERRSVLDGAVQGVRRVLFRVPVLHRLTRGVLALGFRGSAAYWERRYTAGGNSGDGSYGRLAAFKAEVLNGFVTEQGVRSVIEFGCGDGAQLALATYPRYVGLDVARAAVRMCAERFAGDATRSFFVYDPAGFFDRGGLLRADLAMSLDVIYHLVEDETFDGYMRHLFGAAERFVAVYSSNAPVSDPAPHVRHRRFTDWVDANQPGWTLLRHVPNPHPARGDNGSSTADFYFYARTSPAGAMSERSAAT